MPDSDELAIRWLIIKDPNTLNQYSKIRNTSNY